MADGAIYDPQTARWLVNLGKKLESSQLLNPGQIERIVLKVMPRFQGGDGSIKYAFPPSGGIPAASYNSTDEELTPGTASCELADFAAGVYERSGESVIVENPVGAVVGISGKPITIGRTGDGEWTVLVEDCSGTSSGGGGPVVDQDPLGGITDLGITLEV